MNKKIALLVACTVIVSSTFSVSNYNVKAKEKPTQVTSKINQKTNQKVDRSGLLGYYFSDSDFKNPTLYAPTRNGKLMFDITSEDKGLLTKNNSNYKSIKWFGYLKSNTTGDYKLKISDDKNAIIEVNGKIVSNKGEKKETIHLKKGQLVEIKIEYQNKKGIKFDDKILTNMILEKIDKHGKSIKVEQSELNNPEYDKQEKKHLLARSLKSNLFKAGKPNNISLEDDDEDVDTDNDTIPDKWEINGYTVKNRKAVKWEDKFAQEGYKKFTSNPLDAHTVGDPYTDFEKAAKDIDKSNDSSTFNPLVAAYPNVNVSMENMYLSLNENMSKGHESHSSNNWTYTNTEGAEVHAGFSAKEGFSVGASANYSHSETVGSEWGSSDSDITSFNSAEKSFFNSNVRYNNVGTGAIYDVKPTTNFILDGKTFATITAKSNSTALQIPSGESYPKKELSPILLNSMDDFNSNAGIKLNSDQTKAISEGENVKVETTQTDGKFGKINSDGEFEMGEDWNGVVGQIENKTASIIVDSGDEVKERRVFAKDYNNPELRNAPSITLRQAIKLSFPTEVTEKEGLLYYKDRPVFESAVMTYTDNDTVKMIEKQINDKTGKFKDVHTIYDVKLEPKMNFTIKLAKVFFSADHGYKDEGSHWYYTSITSGGVTGGKQYTHAGNGESAIGILSDDIIKDDKEYCVSLYMKADGDVKATIELLTGQDNVLASKDVDLNNKGYQRIDIPVKSIKDKKFNKIYIKSNGGKNIYWDDVSITEKSNVKKNDSFNNEEYVKSFYTNFKVENKNSDGIKKIRFTKDMREIAKHIPKYRVVKTGGKHPHDGTSGSYSVEPDGTLILNFEEYGGYTAEKYSHVIIYAIDNYGREFKVQEFDVNDVLKAEDEDYVKSFYTDHKLTEVVDDGQYYHGNGIRFTKDMREISKHIPKYRIKCTGQDNFDVTQSSYEPSSDGTLFINFLDYNGGRGLVFHDYITIYAINNYGDEFKILESKVKDLE
ncbi:hypothetical protein G4W71_03450 [Clostridium botulinum]|uniref:binary toxin-like calcium binding domain-containing protein n=1 Tax=Clostridium botulinum TaxID=1491 RepID=UPI001788B209|nr:binary toxin-like calcium binding domain-containing protein [Clostridium botulinum]MBE1303099.1 hypothetical protein [Clostridium botulinum]